MRHFSDLLICVGLMVYSIVLSLGQHKDFEAVITAALAVLIIQVSILRDEVEK